MKPIIIFLILSALSYFILPTKTNETKENQTSLDIKIKVSGAVKEQELILHDDSMESLLKQVTLKEDANCKCLDLDRKLMHEDEVYIPSKNDLNISLNHASQQELMQIKGIGEAISNRIIEYRSQQSFKSIEEIMNIKGIGYKTYLKVRSSLCL